jgi:hypothetical protein
MERDATHTEQRSNNTSEQLLTALLLLVGILAQQQVRWRLRSWSNPPPSPQFLQVFLQVLLVVQTH